MLAGNNYLVLELARQLTESMVAGSDSEKKGCLFIVMLTSKQAFQHAAAIERLEGGKKCFMNLKRSILCFLSSKDLVTMERPEKQKKFCPYNYYKQGLPSNIICFLLSSIFNTTFCKFEFLGKKVVDWV